MSVLKHKKNVYSQNGEDGIIEYIFDKMSVVKGTFIEFGAWDGKHLSNTYNLFKNKNWGGIYIEGDSNKFKDLYTNFQMFDSIDCVNAYVGFESHDNLDKLITRHSAKRAFDFVSIDVDGLDYFIFEKFETYLPSVLCIEVNAGHHPEYEHKIPMEIASNNVGQSMKVICDLASKKGYFPLCYTGNLFLIKNEFQHLFTDDLKTLPDIYLDFLHHLGRDGINHLRNVFVPNKYYNNFLFSNKILNDFCSNYRFN
jgi:hypothetical protein